VEDCRSFIRLSTQVCKWVPANLMTGVHPIQGVVEIFLVASCYGNRDKLQPDEPLGSYTDFFFKCGGVLKRYRSLSAREVTSDVQHHG